MEMVTRSRGLPLLPAVKKEREQEEMEQPDIVEDNRLNDVYIKQEMIEVHEMKFEPDEDLDLEEDSDSIQYNTTLNSNSFTLSCDLCGMGFASELYLTNHKQFCRGKKQLILVDPKLVPKNLQSFKKYVNAAECKEKWKNIQAVFVRNMKPPKSGSGTKEKKAYYLSDALQFTVPNVKALGKPSGNLPYPPELQEEELPDDPASMEDLGSEPSVLLERSSVHPSLKSSTSSVDHPGSSIAGSSVQMERLSEPITPSKSKRKRTLQNDALDNAFLQYLNKKATNSNKGQDDAKDPKTDAIKMFLLSLLPDLQTMNAQEVRQFKRRTLDVVDEILSVRSRDTSSISPSTQHHPDIFILNNPQDSDDTNITPLANFFSNHYPRDTNSNNHM